MGRKIPAKKHRGVKDPLAQQARRLESLKGKINAPPKDPDEQPMPQSLIRLFGLEDPKKKENNKRKRHSKIRQLSNKKEEHKTSGASNPISELRKLPGESGRDFSLRINSAVRALHGPLQLSDYPPDLEAEDYKGQRIAAQRERRAKKRRRVEKVALRSDRPPQEHHTRTQKLALKKKAKKLKALERAADGAEVTHERLPFGEVTHAPPVLQRTSSAPRPGRRELLLSGMLQGAGSPKGAAHLARSERARQQAVDAYRAIKANKRKRT